MGCGKPGGNTVGQCRARTPVRPTLPCGAAARSVRHHQSTMLRPAAAVSQHTGHTSHTWDSLLRRGHDRYGVVELVPAPILSPLLPPFLPRSSSCCPASASPSQTPTAPPPSPPSPTPRPGRSPTRPPGPPTHSKPPSRYQTMTTTNTRPTTSTTPARPAWST